MRNILITTLLLILYIGTSSGFNQQQKDFKSITLISKYEVMSGTVISKKKNEEELVIELKVKEDLKKIILHNTPGNLYFFDNTCKGDRVDCRVHENQERVAIIRENEDVVHIHMFINNTHTSGN